MAKPIRVYTRSGKEWGTVTDKHYRECTMEGCRGSRVKVVWKDGRYTLPCSAGLKPYKGHLKIMQEKTMPDQYGRTVSPFTY